MKIYIVLVALMAFDVDAQIQPSPFTSFISNYYNRRGSPQVNFEPYVPYQTSSTNGRTYVPYVVVTPSPTTFFTYKSTIADRQSNNLFQSPTTTLRPYIISSTTQASATVPPYNAAFTASQSYSPNQILAATRRPYVFSVITPAPTLVPIYNVPKSSKIYQTSNSTNRPSVTIVTTPAPTRIPLYNAPSLAPQSYRPYQISTTTNRPYIPIVSTPATTIVPLSNSPYQISTATLRSYIPIAPSTSKPYQPPTIVTPTVSYHNGGAHLANTLRSENQINPDGKYNWFFETDNGIAAQAQGAPKNFGGNPPFVGEDVKGAFSWTAPNGEFIDFTYTADEAGYHPKSNAIPTPPPVPPHVVRLLEYLSRVAGSKK